MSVKKNITIDDIRWADFNNKYFILHYNDSAWFFSNVNIENNIISGDLEILPGIHYKYLTTKTKGGNRYKKKTESFVLDEVQLYLKDSLFSDLKANENISFNFTAIEKLEIYTKDIGRTNTSRFLATFVPIGCVGIVFTVWALTKSSCPLVYIKNDNEFAFAGEIFGGAVYKSLERHDYMPLPDFKPSDNNYVLKINNELPEIQYINLAELLIISHPENISVLPDRNGKIQTISKADIPVAASSASGNDILNLISQKDQKCFLFDEEPNLTGDTNAINSLVLSFKIDQPADTGKLYIKAGNSDWGDYISGEFIKLFGNKYDEWIKKQGKEPAEKNIRWKMDQRFVLMVYLETNSGWKFIDYFDLIGPLGEREMVMPFELTNAKFINGLVNENIIRIKLESGFKFWELDYAAMDFKPNTSITLNSMKPSSAITENGKDVRILISENDNNYYIQKRTGEEGLVIYPDCADIPGMKKSIFLHTKGYYEHVRDFNYPPDKEKLLTFMTPGRLSQFSFQNYQNFIVSNSILVSNPTLP